MPAYCSPTQPNAEDRLFAVTRIPGLPRYDTSSGTKLALVTCLLLLLLWILLFRVLLLRILLFRIHFLWILLLLLRIGRLLIRILLLLRISLLLLLSHRTPHPFKQCYPITGEEVVPLFL